MWRIEFMPVVQEQQRILLLQPTVWKKTQVCPFHVVLWNGLRYRSMINKFLWPESGDMNEDDVYFQQDGATCYASVETICLLLEKFPGRVISLHGDYNWPPRSCDSTLQRENFCRYRRNKTPNVRQYNGKSHQKSMVLQTEPWRPYE